MEDSNAPIVEDSDPSLILPILLYGLVSHGVWTLRDNAGFSSVGCGLWAAREQVRNAGACLRTSLGNMPSHMRVENRLHKARIRWVSWRIFSLDRVVQASGVFSRCSLGMGMVQGLFDALVLKLHLCPLRNPITPCLIRLFERRFPNILCLNYQFELEVLWQVMLEGPMGQVVACNPMHVFSQRHSGMLY